MPLSDQTKERWQRFRSMRRAWWSLLLIAVAYGFSLTAPWLVNDRPLLLHWEGRLLFPFIAFHAETEFGGNRPTEPDYPSIIAEARGEGREVWAIMPPIPHNPLKARLEAAGSPPYAPSSKHWLGTDAHGRDLLARLVHGFRISMTFSLLLSFLGLSIGVLMGGAQGYLGGKTDIAGQRFTEIWSSLPFLYVVILLGSIYGRGFFLLLFIMAIFQWVGVSYYMRGEFLRLRQMPWVKAARMAGMGDGHIFFREILPNAIAPLVTLLPFLLVGGISALTSLDFLGFGLQPPTPSWGELLSQGLSNLYAWWITASTVAALFLTLLLATFVGEGVREAMDPKSGDRFEGTSQNSTSSKSSIFMPLLAVPFRLITRKLRQRSP